MGAHYNTFNFLFAIAAICLTGVLGKYQQLKNLKDLTDEFQDCDVTYLLFAEDLAHAPLTTITPIRLFKTPPLHSIHLNQRHLTRKHHFQFAIFMLFRDFVFTDFDQMKQAFTNHTFEFHYDAQVFVNVLLHHNSILRMEGQGNLLPRLSPLQSFNEILSIFRLVNKGDVDSTGTYSVFSLIVSVPIQLLENVSHFTQIRAQVAEVSCYRNSILKEAQRLRTIGSRVYVDALKYTKRLTGLYATRNISTRNLYTFKAISELQIKSPFQSYHHLWTSSTLIRHLVLYSLDIWIYLEKPEFLKDTPKLINIVGDIRKGVDMVIGTWKSLGSMLEVDKTYGIVPTGEDFLNFMTCDGVIQPISFYFYSVPYDVGSWSAILGFTFWILPFFVWMASKAKTRVVVGRKVREENGLSLFVDVVFYNLSLGFEVSPEVPKLLGSMTPAITLVLGLWSLFTVVLVNAYKGIVTADLTSHAPISGNFTKLVETEGFTFYAGIYVFGRIENLIRSKTLSRFGTQVHAVPNLKGCLCYPDVPAVIPLICQLGLPRRANWSYYSESDSCAKVSGILNSLNLTLEKPPKPTFCAQNHGDGIIRGLIHHYRQNGKLPENTKGLKLRCDRVYLIHRQERANVTKWSPIPFQKSLLVPMKYLDGESDDTPIYQSISNCDKSGYIGRNHELDRLIASSVDVNYRKGSEKIFHTQTGIALYRGDYLLEQIYRSLLRLRATGIYQIWEEWYTRFSKSEEKKSHSGKTANKTEGQEVPLSIKSNIKTIFFAWLGFIPISILAFGIENIS